jgi:hypothetical protein
MTRPTELANVKFTKAAKWGAGVKEIIMKNPTDPLQHGAALVVLSDAVAEMALGLAELSTGIRATYILLEQIQIQNRK